MFYVFVNILDEFLNFFVILINFIIKCSFEKNIFDVGEIKGYFIFSYKKERRVINFLSEIILNIF